MGTKSRRKGNHYELEVVHAMQDAGIAAEKIPLSGAAGGSFSGDITAPIVGIDRTFECKRRSGAGGFAMLYRWLGSNYGLCLRADREVGLVVLRQSDFLALVKEADARRTDYLESEARFQRAVANGTFNGMSGGEG